MSGGVVSGYLVFVHTVASSSPPDLTAISLEVAHATDLREGAGGVWEVVRQVARHEPVAIRDLSRLTGLPVPVVAAVCGELRARGVLEKTRPVTLGPVGRQLSASLSYARDLACTCSLCGGRQAVVPPALLPVLEELAPIASAAPRADLTLDQAHCTVETKLLRAAHLLEMGRLTSGPMLFLGDDDLTSVAVALVAIRAGLRPVLPKLAVAELDSRLIEYLRETLGGLGVDATVMEYDARHPLPRALSSTFATVVTDPPYTVSGAGLFVSRAVAALGTRVHGEVFLCFGPRGPDETLAVERSLNDMGLFTRALIRNFNTYVGAGTLGGVSHLYHLGATAGAKPLIEGTHEGDLYTARPNRVRPYRCADCGERVPVGQGEHFTTIAELKEQGCPRCGNARFRPLPLLPTSTP